MEWRPRHKRLFVFSIPEREKIGSGLLYQARANTGNLSEVREVWVLNWASDCTFTWKRGQKVFVQDGFELEPVRMNDLWDQYKDHPDFADLKAFAEKVGGRVDCEIVAEGSLLATTHPEFPKLAQ